MTVGDRRYLKRGEAGQRLKELLAQEVAALDGLRQRSLRPAQLGGFPLTADIERALGTTSVTMALDGAPGTATRLSSRELQDADPVGMVTRLENRLGRLEERKAEALAGAERANREITHARETIGQPFPQAAQLTQARDRARQIDEQLHQMAVPAQAGAEACHDAPPRPSPDVQPKDRPSSRQALEPACPPRAERNETSRSAEAVTPSKHPCGARWHRADSSRAEYLARVAYHEAGQ
jgi:hypothetical protein